MVQIEIPPVHSRTVTEAYVTNIYAILSCTCLLCFRSSLLFATCPPIIFFSLRSRTAFDELEKATQVAIKAIEAGLNEAQQANAKRQEELKAAKAKNDEAAAKEAFLTVATPKKLTFYEQMQLNAKKAGTTLDGLAKDAQQGVTAANTEGAAELARRNETKTKQ